MVAPGLVHPLYIRATPENKSPVKHACFVVQLATTYPRDHVIGFFAVTVKVEFMNYKEEPEKVDFLKYNYESIKKSILPKLSSQLTLSS